MVKKEFRIPIGGKTRLKTVLVDIESTAGSEFANQRLHYFLQEVLDSPGLMQCGLATPQTLRMEHVGQAWTLTMEAEVEEEPHTG